MSTQPYAFVGHNRRVRSELSKKIRLALCWLVGTSTSHDRRPLTFAENATHGEFCLHFTSQQFKRAYTQQCSFAILVLMLLLSSVTQLRAATVTAQWNPNPESNIAGYLISYGTTSGSYATTIDVGKVTSTSLTIAGPATYFFALRAYNTSGATSPFSSEVSVNVPATTTAPVIVSLTPSSGSVGTTVNVAGSNFGSTKGTSTVTFNGTAASPTSWSASTIAVPVPAGATTGNVVVTVGGVASNGSIFTIATQNLPPVLTNPGNQTSTAGATVSLQLSATDPNGTALTYSASGLPTGLSISSATGLISGKAPASAGTFNVTASASDGSLSASQTFTWTITAGGTNVVSLVQHIEQDAGTATSTSVGFSSANTAGNFIAVVARAGNPNQTFTVSDTRGNTYKQAVKFNNNTDNTVAVFYAENIAAGANTVTVSDSASGTLRLSLLEYRGIAGSSSFDAAQAATGTGTSPSSGVIQTSAGGDLLIGVLSFANGVSLTPGSSFALESAVPAQPGAKLIVEDSVFAASGSASAAGTMSASDSWGAGIVAFKAGASGGGGGGSAPGITSLTPSTGPVGTAVTIAGSNFGSTRGTSTVTFNGTPATTTSWSASSIVVPVPSGATTGSVVVTVGSVASNSQTFTVTTSSAPVISGLTPATGPVGTSVTIAGSNFGSTRGASTVTFNGTAATPTSGSASSIVVPVPSGATTGMVVVTVGGVASNSQTFTVTTATSPVITSLSPTSGPVGTSVTISGSNFGSSKGTSTVSFNGTAASPTSWSATSIAVPVPSGATTGNVVVTVGGVASNGQTFTVATPASISLVQHVEVDAGTTTNASKSFAAANTGGNFIALAVRAGVTNQTFTISDTRGNVYRQAARFNNNNDNTVALYYAENIGAGANTVTITMPSSATLRFSLLEYRGILTSASIDGAVTATGAGTSANSGKVTTTANGDLLIGVITTANEANITPGSGFALEGTVPALPNAKLVVEDAVQATAGANAATVTLSASDSWGAALVAFKAAAASGVMSQALMASASGPVQDDSSRASDYDGDGKSDLAVFTPSTGKWAVLQSTSNYTNSFSVTLGTSTDVPVPGDYDGDGKADAAVFTPSTGKWTVLKSSSSFGSTMSTTWGVSGDVPVPGDYDGDRKTDFAVFRPSTGEWLITLSATQTTTTIVLGGPGDKPVAGDYDGDGLTDLAVYTPSTGTWTVLTSSSNFVKRLTGRVGVSSDLLVPGDYDGDGRTDMAVYRPSTGAWLILGSATGFATTRTVTLGSSGDIPVPGDYDADGLTDVATYRPATGQWSIVKSSDGSTLTSVWGTSGSDVPLPRHP
jgi:hypothetical protein